MAQLTFAVDAGHAVNPFDCELRVTINTAAGARRMDLLLQVRPGHEENQLFIAPALVAPTTPYTWIAVRAVSQANPATNVGGSQGSLRILRDNRTVRGFNREYPLGTDGNGFCKLQPGGLAGGNQDRTTIGVPLNLPLAFDLYAVTFERRVHLLKLLPAQRTGHHNNIPFAPGNVTLIPTTGASLASHTFCLDPGHGVVYNAAARRCYEWFLSHRTAHHIADLLTSRYGVAPTDITFMRSAGLALLDPDLFVAATPALTGMPPGPHPPATAPEQPGDLRYRYDMTLRTVHTVDPTRTLTHVSSLLLATHEATLPFGHLPIPDADRTQILTDNPATVAACITRTAAGLHGRAPVPNSERWDPAGRRYVFDTVPATNPAGARQTHEIAITPADAWAVNDDALRNLAARTARWSILREGLGGDSFSTRTRDAMIANGAVDYMSNACFEEADQAPGHPFLAHGIKGWSFALRRQLIHGLSPAPDITLTLHHNAVPPGGDSEGLIMLVSNPASATEAHVRLQKTCLKYVTGLGAGLHGMGMTQGHSSAMNGPLYVSVIPGYAFFEVEFMNAPSGATATPFEYERMAPDAFVRHLAEEMVEALVEFLIAPQPNAEFDPVDVGAGIVEGTVHW
jgi:hypothetical protein